MCHISRVKDCNRTLKLHLYIVRSRRIALSLNLINIVTQEGVKNLNPVSVSVGVPSQVIPVDLLV